MKIKNLLLLTLLLSGVMILSACAPEASPEEMLEPTEQEGVPYPEPTLENKQPLQPSDPQEAYPAPQELISDGSTSVDPYPGVEVVGSSSDRDLSGAITVDEFRVLSTDKDLVKGPVFIEHSEIIMKESYPVQVELVLAGNLPTPCNLLRVVHTEPDENGHIEIEAYSVVDLEKMCIQVLEPFTAVIPLGEYTEGTFTLSINNELMGEFKLP